MCWKYQRNPWATVSTNRKRRTANTEGRLRCVCVSKVSTTKSWRLATYLALQWRRMVAAAAVHLEECPFWGKSISVSPDPSTGWVRATGRVKTRVRTEKSSPGTNLKPCPHPEKTKTTFGFVVCTVTSCGGSLMSIEFPQMCRTGCRRPGAGVKGQGRVFEPGRGWS